MGSLIKNIFMMLAGCVAAVILYLGLFGWGNTGFMSSPNKSIESTTYETGTSEYKGVLHYAVYEVEKAVSDYYLKYCFEPNIFKDWEVDADLGLWKLAYSASPAHVRLDSYHIYNEWAMINFNSTGSYPKTDYHSLYNKLRDNSMYLSIKSPDDASTKFEHYSSGWF